MRIILASQSPRRSALLRQLGISFTVIPSGYDEKMHPPLSPQKLVAYLSLQKAARVAAIHKEDLIIAADTVVIIGKTILGKAHSVAEARSMLHRLSGKKHIVVTGLTVVFPPAAESAASPLDKPLTKTCVVSSAVYFKKLTPAEIDWYVATSEPLGKAGAYAIQERGALFVEKIDGSYSAIVGLPLEKLYALLKKPIY